MWDQDDTFARWIQGICAMLLLVFAVGDAVFVVQSFGLFYGIVGITLFFGSLRLCYRCAFYAITGRGNVNRD